MIPKSISTQFLRQIENSSIMMDDIISLYKMVFSDSYINKCVFVVYKNDSREKCLGQNSNL